MNVLLVGGNHFNSRQETLVQEATPTEDSPHQVRGEVHGFGVIISLSTMSYLEEDNSARQIFCLVLLLYSKTL